MLIRQTDLGETAEFYIDNIRPISWSEDAFERLVLPLGYKDLIYAFVREQLRNEDASADLIQGKGMLKDRASCLT